MRADDRFDRFRVSGRDGMSRTIARRIANPEGNVTRPRERQVANDPEDRCGYEGSVRQRNPRHRSTFRNIDRERMLCCTGELSRATACFGYFVVAPNSWIQRLAHAFAILAAV